jgi:hypothetical protein
VYYNKGDAVIEKSEILQKLNDKLFISCLKYWKKKILADLYWKKTSFVKKICGWCIITNKL